MDDDSPLGIGNLPASVAAAATAIVRVTPICGARQETSSPPACYLLEVDSARILLDAGTTSTFDMSHFTLLKKLLGRAPLDLVLLSHGDLAHCGGLPYLIANLQVRCPVLATLPVHHLGLVSVYDAYQSQWQATGNPPTAFSLDDLDAAFERMTMLRYAQSYTLAGGGGETENGSFSAEYRDVASSSSALTVTPVAAGRTVGGAIWRIRRHTEDIWYAMGFNHRREIHLDGASLELVQRPSLLIADAGGALDVPIPRKQRDSSLHETLMAALRGGHSVLLPVDTAGRSLELLQVIEQLWATHKPPYPAFFLSHQARRVLELAKGMLEWMSVSLARVFETDRSNPWELKHVRPVHSLEDLEKVVNTTAPASSPRVILATLETLEAGWARVLLGQTLEKAMQAGGNKLPLLVLMTGTRKSGVSDQDGGISAVLAERIRMGVGCERLEWAEQVPLEGEELRRFHREAQEAVERRAAEEAFAQLRAEQAEDEEEEEEEEEEELRHEGEPTIGGARGDESVNGAEGASRSLTSRRRADEEIKVSARRLEREQIASAVALQHVYWSDYRHDWFIKNDDKTLVTGNEASSIVSSAALNSPFYPLLPPDEAPFAEDGTPRRYQCFPIKEPRRIVDDYGEMVDYTTEFSGGGGSREAMVPRSPPMIPGGHPHHEPRGLQLLAPIAEEINVGGNKTPVTTTVTVPAIPLKWVKRSLDGCTLRVPCKFIDFVGSSDGRSLRTIYARIAPRRLLLVGGGGGEAADFLTNYFVQARAAAVVGTIGPEETWAPGVGETITVCSAVNVLPALLSESLIGTLRVHALGEHEVAWIRGWLGREGQQLPQERKEKSEEPDMSMEVDTVLHADAAPNKPHDQMEEGETGRAKKAGEEEGEDGEERIAPEHASSKLLVITAHAGLASSPSSARGMLLGDVRLSEVRRQVINELRLPANFLPGGELIIGQGERRLCLRKVPNQPASFFLEGPLCPEYYALRALIYSTTAYLS